MILKLKRILGSFGISYSSGLAQIPLIVGLLLMAVAIPAATKLVQENSDTRNRAAGGCRTYGECCGCQSTKEIEECDDGNGNKTWRESRGCQAQTGACMDRCSGQPQPTNPPSGGGGGGGTPSCPNSWEVWQDGACRRKEGSGCTTHSDCADGKQCINWVCGGGPGPTCSDKCNPGTDTGQVCRGGKKMYCGNDWCWKTVANDNSCAPTPTQTPVGGVTVPPVAQPTGSLAGCQAYCSSLGYDVSSGDYGECVRTCAVKLTPTGGQCVPGQTSCSGGKIKVCSDSRYWLPDMACAGGVCANATACATCPGVCTDGAQIGVGMSPIAGTCPAGQQCWAYGQYASCDGKQHGTRECYAGKAGYNYCNNGKWNSQECGTGEGCIDGVCKNAWATTITPGAGVVPTPVDPPVGECSNPGSYSCKGQYSAFCTSSVIGGYYYTDVQDCGSVGCNPATGQCCVGNACKPVTTVAPNRCLWGDSYCTGKTFGNGCGWKETTLGGLFTGRCTATVLGHCICNILDKPGAMEDDPACKGRRGAVCDGNKSVFCVYENVPGVGSILKVQTEETCPTGCDGETGKCKVGSGCNWFTSSSYCQNKSVGQSCTRQHAPGDTPVPGVCVMDPDNFAEGGCACVETPVNKCEGICRGVKCSDFGEVSGFGSCDDLGHFTNGESFYCCVSKVEQRCGEWSDDECDSDGQCASQVCLNRHASGLACVCKVPDLTLTPTRPQNPVGCGSSSSCNAGASNCRSGFKKTGDCTTYASNGGFLVNGVCCAPDQPTAKVCSKGRCVVGTTCPARQKASGDSCATYMSPGPVLQGGICCEDDPNLTTPVMTPPWRSDLTPGVTRPPTTPGGGGPGPGPGPGGSSCDYTSLQLRVQRNVTDPWTKSLTIEGGQTINVGCMYNGSGQLADQNKVKMMAKYADGTDVEIGKNVVTAWSPTKNGRVDIRCESTVSNCPLNSGGDSTVLIVSGTVSGCYQCPSNFECYKKGTDYKWFVEGYVMGGYEKVTESQCTAASVAKPTFKGKYKGDADCSGYVDGADYSVWRREYVDERKIGSRWEADFSCKGSTDNTDYSIWRKSSIDERNDR